MGRPAPSSTRLPLHGVLNTRKGRTSFDKQAGSMASGQLPLSFVPLSPDSSRHGMSWKICRFSATRPEPRFAQEPPGLSPFPRLFRFSASVDLQMTPALFAGAFRASPLRPAHWRIGCRASLREPSDLKHHAAPDCGKGMAVFEPRWEVTSRFFELKPPD